MVFQNNVLGGASNSGTTGYTIDQSIRFNPGDSSYMHKTYSGAGDRTAWTFSTWFKLGLCNGFAAGSGLYYVFFSCDAGTSDANRGIFSINNDSSVRSNSSNTQNVNETITSRDGMLVSAVSDF